MRHRTRPHLRSTPSRRRADRLRSTVWRACLSRRSSHRRRNQLYGGLSSSRSASKFPAELDTERLLDFGRGIALCAGGLHSRLENSQMIKHVAQVFLQPRYFAALALDLRSEILECCLSRKPRDDVGHDAPPPWFPQDRRGRGSRPSLATRLPGHFLGRNFTKCFSDGKW